MQSAFQSWVGQHVLVRLILGTIRVSLRGILLKDRTETLLMGPEFGSELEIPKDVILAIEEVGTTDLPFVLAPFESLARPARMKGPNAGWQVGWTNPPKYSLYREDSRNVTLRRGKLSADFSQIFRLTERTTNP